MFLKKTIGSNNVSRSFYCSGYKPLQLLRQQKPFPILETNKTTVVPHPQLPQPAPCRRGEKHCIAEGEEIRQDCDAPVYSLQAEHHTSGGFLYPLGYETSLRWDLISSPGIHEEEYSNSPNF